MMNPKLRENLLKSMKVDLSKAHNKKEVLEKFNLMCIIAYGDDWKEVSLDDLDLKESEENYD